MIVAPDFTDHWKTETLVRLAGSESAIRCLLRFWAHCQNRRQSRFKGMTPSVLAHICKWVGDERKFWDAMMETFCEKKGDYLVAHDWDVTNSRLLACWKGGQSTQSRSRAKAKPTAKPKAKPQAQPEPTPSQPELSQGDKSRVEKRDKRRVPPTVPQGGQAGEPDLISDEAEAKRLICELILKGKNPARPWSYEAQAALARQLPIPRREIKLVAWFHGLAADDEVQELKVRRQSESTLLPFWSDEVTRAAAFRKKIGGGGLNGTSQAKKEPAGWREYFRWKYGSDVHLPAQFSSLGADQLREWEAEHEAFEREAAKK